MSFDASGWTRRWIVVGALAALLAAAACGGKPAPRSSGRGHATAPRSSSGPSSRSVLASYLDLTFSGRHERAWSLLTDGDQSQVSRSTYIRQQESNDRIRARLRALGPFKYRIASLSEGRSRADAVVAVTTGLGHQRVRFVLRRERDHWRVDYDNSWSDLP